jgi:N-acetylmuramoyl-L-alanine amidase
MRQSGSHRVAFILVTMVFMFTGCGGLPSSPGGATIFVPSPNHNERRPNYIILHDTSNDNIERPLKTLTDPAREVSAHYLIGRDGTRYQLVDENRRAWHAGQSYWGGITDLNSASIGIELDNTGDEPYAEAQIDRLIGLLKELQARHRIPSGNILGHGDVALRRKVDPGWQFPWARLADQGFGLWCKQAPARADPLPDPALVLQAIGYDVADPAAALVAFRRHFLGITMAGEATDEERRLMHCLVLEKRKKSTEDDPQ